MFSSGSPKPSSGGTQRSNTSLSKVRPLIYSDSLELISNPGSTKSSRKLIPPIDDHVVQAFKPVKTGLPLYFANGSSGEMENLNTIDRDGLSALHRAVRINNIQDVKNMMDCGADINLKDKDGFTPIHTAVRYVGLINARIPKGVIEEMQIRYILAWCALVIWQTKAYFECARAHLKRRRLRKTKAKTTKQKTKQRKQNRREETKKEKNRTSKPQVEKNILPCISSNFPFNCYGKAKCSVSPDFATREHAKAVTATCRILPYDKER